MIASLRPRFLSALPLLASIVLAACGPSNEEIQQLVDARVGALQQRLEEEKVIKTLAELEEQKAAQANKPEWVKSLDFLATLDTLMADYAPTLPTATDNTDLLRCTTDDEFASNAVLAGAAKSLGKQRAASNREVGAQRAQILREFEQTKWIQYRIDLAWNSRVVASKNAFGCWYFSRFYGEDSADIYPEFYNTKEKCESDAQYAGKIYWRKREERALYSGRPVSEPHSVRPPELMTRMEAAHVVTPSRFSCLVDQVSRAEDGARTLMCLGSGSGVGAYIRLPASDAAVTYHIGDVVSVPLKDTKRDPNGVLFKEVWNYADHWVVSADPASVTVDLPATCPTVDEIVAASAPR